MLILAADTSGKNGSLALVRFHNRVPQTLDVVPIEGGTFSAQMIPQIGGLLQKHGLRKNDMDAFAVVSGPGSFTGLRVGLAAIKALAEILNKPIATVSLLEALARSPEIAGQTPNRVVAALDAGRGEVCSRIFEVESSRGTCISQDLQSIAEFIVGKRKETVVTPDGKLAETLAGAKLSVALVPRPTADAIARLGFEKIDAGEVITPEALDAGYIRRSDAEIKFSK